MLNILVTGSGGQLGSEFRALADQYPQWSFTCPNRQELDICDEAQIQAFFKENNFDYCLNTAAYTAVDKAEEEINTAYSVNRDAVIFLAKQCKKHGCQLIHFSTDYVYKDGIDRPLIETDPTAPDGVYAASKLEGDQQAFAILPSTMIVRTSWVYSVYGHNFVKTMLRLGRERDQLGIVFDQIGSPTNAFDLAVAILGIIQSVESNTISKDKLAGVFHYSNEGVCSWYDFALNIFELTNTACKVLPIESKAYPTPAQRPHFSVLNKGKIKTTFGIEIPYWRDSLAKCISLLQEN